MKLVSESMKKSHMNLTLSNDLALVPPAVRFLRDSAAQVGLCNEQQKMRLAVALEEAILNGIIHGNLEISSEVREQGSSRFYQLLQTRRDDPRFGERCLKISVSLNRHEARFTITDEGPGFDLSRVPNPTDPENLTRCCGRGILLMHAFVDQVTYNERGNQVTLIYRRTPAESTSRENEPACSPC